MKKRRLVILLAALIFSLTACARQAEQTPAAEAPPVLVLPAEDAAQAGSEEEAEEAPEPEREWTQEEIRRMYQGVAKPEWTLLDCLTTPDKANGCVGAALYWDGEQSTLVRFFDEDGYSCCAGPVAKTAQDADFTYLGGGKVSFRLQTDDGTAYDYTLTLEKTEDDASWTARDSLTVPNP